MAIAGITLMSIGGLLVISGLGLVIYQILMWWPPDEHSSVFSASATRFSWATTYPGIVIICVGAVLMLAGGFVAN